MYLKTKFRFSEVPFERSIISVVPGVYPDPLTFLSFSILSPRHISFSVFPHYWLLGQLALHEPLAF